MKFQSNNEKTFSEHYHCLRKLSSFNTIIEELDTSRPFFRMFIIHGSLVAQKALKGAKKVSHLNPDLDFIFEACLIHDIGSIHTYAPGIDCFGKAPYLQHGILGGKILRKNNLEKLALVCERHIGTGISEAEILSNKLPLPPKDYLPVSLEEKLVCWADKFFSKGKTPEKEISIDKISEELFQIAPYKKEVFIEWNNQFGE